MTHRWYSSPPVPRHLPKDSRVDSGPPPEWGPICRDSLWSELVVDRFLTNSGPSDPSRRAARFFPDVSPDRDAPQLLLLVDLPRHCRPAFATNALLGAAIIRSSQAPMSLIVAQAALMVRLHARLAAARRRYLLETS